MFDEKDYVCICHGCGTIHIKKSCFMSVPMSVGVEAPDGRQWCLPALGCSTCMATNRGTEENPIRNAWKNGMTPAAYQNAQKNFLEQFYELPLKRSA
jgi:hypothetical protein